MDAEQRVIGRIAHHFRKPLRRFHRPGAAACEKREGPDFHLTSTRLRLLLAQAYPGNFGRGINH